MMCKNKNLQTQVHIKSMEQRHKYAELYESSQSRLANGRLIE